MKSKINANRALMAEKSKFNKFLTLLAVLLFGIGNVWGTEVTVGYTTGLGDKNATTTTRSIADVDHVTITHIINSGTSGALSLYAKSDKSLYYGSSTATYSYGGYKWNVNTGTTFNDNYVGFQVDIDDGYKLSLTELELTLAVSAGFTCKVEITDGTNNLYSSDSWAIANNGKNGTNGINPTFTAVGNPDLQDLTGTFYVRVQLAFSSTGKYLCCPIFTVTGELEETGGGTPVDVTGITLAPSSATIKVGKTVTLVPTITPSNATDKAVTWSVTSGSTYASVTDAGVVTGLAAGTAVITATAHDGSGVTQTATITVEECPTSGTLFSMNITAAEGTTYTGNNTFPALIEATYVGGQAYSGSKSGTNRTSTIDANGEYPFSANSELAIKVIMDCDLAEGDIIDITTSSTRQIKIQKVVGTDLYKTASKTFTIPSGSALIGENVFYLMRDNSESTLGSLTVTRPIYRTITLEYADGTTPDGSLDVIDGTAATKPADPTWAHHRFAGWYNGASPYDWASTVSGDITLTAHWTQLYTITYAAGDGTATGDAPTQEDKAEGETFSVAANPFTVAGKDFVTWNDGANDYAPSATYTVGTDNVILTAQWTTAADKYTVHYMDEDGTTPLGADELVNVGEHPAGITATKPLFTFASWQLSGSDIALSSVSAAKDEEVTLTARWTKAYATSYDMEAYAASVGASKAGLEEELTAAGYAYTNINGIDNGHTHNYTYDGMKYKTNDGDLSFNVVAGKVVEVKTGHLPSNDAVIMNINGVADATVFEGADETSETHKTNYFYSAVEALYRLDVLASKGTCAVKAVTIRDPFTVSFAAHGDADPSPLNGTPSVTLPDATNGTASLLGWFDAETGGNKIGDAGATYIPTANITLHAQWESVSTDARLASITFSAAGTLSPAFDPEVTNYTYTMPYGTAAIPTITGATSVSAKAQEPQIVSQASAWGETAVIRGVAESSDTKAYNITMVKAPKDGVCLVWADIPSANTLTYNASKSLLAEEAVTLAIDKIDGKDPEAPSGVKFQKKGYIKIAMNEGTFQEGDVVALDVTYGASSAMHVFKVQTPSSDADVIGTGDGATTPAGVNKVAITEDATTLYLARPNDGIYNGWNPHVDYVAVYRPMNPVLKKVTVNGEEGAPVGTAVTIEVPFTTTQSQLEAITYDWVSNNDAWTAAHDPAVANAWEFGVENTVTFTDKDGDVSVYTITVNKASASTDATLSALTVNGNAVALVPGQYTYDVELPHGTSVAPTVVATANHIAAVATVDLCTLTGATITVVPESGVGDQQIYTLNFTICPWEDVVIWDGSNMTELATSPGAHGLAWEVVNFSGVTGAANGYKGTPKADTKMLVSNGASPSKYMKITVPTGYVAKFYTVFASHSESAERGFNISTELAKEPATNVYAASSVDKFTLVSGTSEIVGAGDVYFNPSNSIDFYEIRVLLRPGYGRKVSNNIGTLCVDHNVPAGGAQGATFYQIAGKNAEGKLVFDEVTELEAGKPYIFQSTTGGITLYYGATSVANPVEYKGMVGSFSDKHVDIDDSNKTNIMYIASNKLWDCSDLTPAPGYLEVVANRAYIFNYSGIGAASPNPAPGRRRITVGKDQATGFDQLDASETPMKVIIDGQLFILRGEKMYNANGQLVK